MLTRLSDKSSDRPATPVCGWADVDTDGDVDLADYEVLWTCPSPPAVDLPQDGDYDGDGYVDEADHDEFVPCLGTVGPTDPCKVFDFDSNGDIDYGDYAILLELLYHPVGDTVYVCLEQQPDDTSPLGNPYYFTGRRLDVIPVPGDPRQIYYYRARNYDPFHGRFMQRDPSGYTDGMNLYEYAGSNPVVRVDPTGREWVQDPKDDALYKPTGDTATLWQLVQKVKREKSIPHLNDKRDWACLWPVEPQGGLTPTWQRKLASYKGNTNMVGCCLKFDVSNLLPRGEAGPTIQWSIAQDRPAVGGAFQLHKKSAKAVISELKEKSGQAKNPVSLVRILGHGSGDRRFVSEFSGGKGDQFGYRSIRSAAQAKSTTTVRYRNAVARKGPPRCWFATDATVRILGCETYGMGNNWRLALGRGAQDLKFTNKLLEVGTGEHANMLRFVDDGSPPWLKNYEELERDSRLVPFRITD